MADRKGMMEIEDVLSSIRRLVAADTRTAPAPVAPREAEDRLVLTPAQRVDEPDMAGQEPFEPESAEQEPEAAAGRFDSVRAWDDDSRADQSPVAESAEDLEATLAALEAALDDDLSDSDVSREADDGLRDEVEPAWETAEAEDPLPEPDAALPADMPADAEPEHHAPAPWEAAAFEEAPGDVAALPEAGGLSPFDPGEAAAHEPDGLPDVLHGTYAPSDPAEPELPAEPDAWLQAEATEDETAAERTPRHGFIWEGAFDDTLPDDLPPVPESLAHPIDDDAAPVEAPDAPAFETDEVAEAGGWPMPRDVTETEGEAFTSVEAFEDAPAPLPTEIAAEEPEPSQPVAEDLPEPAAELPEVPAAAAAAGFAIDADPGEEEADLAGLGLFDGDENLPLDEAALRDLVAEIIRDELRGPLGARIARNLRHLVRQEIARELAARGLSEDG